MFHNFRKGIEGSGKLESKKPWQQRLAFGFAELVRTGNVPAQPQDIKFYSPVFAELAGGEADAIERILREQDFSKYFTRHLLESLNLNLYDVNLIRALFSLNIRDRYLIIARAYELAGIELSRLERLYNIGVYLFPMNWVKATYNIAMGMPKDNNIPISSFVVEPDPYSHELEDKFRLSLLASLARYDFERIRNVLPDRIWVQLLTFGAQPEIIIKKQLAPDAEYLVKALAEFRPQDRMTWEGIVNIIRSLKYLLRRLSYGNALMVDYPDNTVMLAGQAGGEKLDDGQLLFRVGMKIAQVLESNPDVLQRLQRGKKQFILVGRDAVEYYVDEQKWITPEKVLLVITRDLAYQPKPDLIGKVFNPINGGLLDTQSMQLFLYLGWHDSGVIEFSLEGSQIMIRANPRFNIK